MYDERMFYPINTESFYIPPTAEPNLNPLMGSFSGTTKTEEEQDQSVSLESGGVSGSEQDYEQPKKKRYHRHTLSQIQQMEAVFSECPHPDDKVRQRLSEELGLKPRQVKFWFQNRRTQMKAQQDRNDNAILRSENESLRSENGRLQAAIRSVLCSSCGGSFGSSLYCQQLSVENAKLKQELQRLREIISTCITVQQLEPEVIPPEYPCSHNGVAPRAPILTEEDNTMALELAISSMNELLKKASINEPLWARRGVKDVLEIKEYLNMFPWPVRRKTQFEMEASRGSILVSINSLTLVESFLDVEKWKNLFPMIVARAKAIPISTSGCSGTLLLMYAELHMVTPLIPSREACFVRYIRRDEEEGSWVVVDFTVDELLGKLGLTQTRSCRRPSGCIIHELTSGFSKVVWVEHWEMEEEGNIHPLFKERSSSFFASGRWLSALHRQCERRASLITSVADITLMTKRSVMNLAERMVATFCLIFTSAGEQSWATLLDDDAVRITTRRQINGLILSAASSASLPHPHRRILDAIGDERVRFHLLPCNEAPSYEILRISTGSDPGNFVSLIRVSSSEVILQESCVNDSASLVVYASMSVEAAQMVMNGEDMLDIPLLPVGFVVEAGNDVVLGGDDAGCVVTVGLQVLASTNSSAKLNLPLVNGINAQLSNTLVQIAEVIGAKRLSDDSNDVCLPVSTH